MKNTVSLLGPRFAACLVTLALAPVAAGAVVAPPPCAEANGVDTYEVDTRYPGGIVVALYASQTAPGTVQPVLHSCLAEAQLRLTVPSDFATVFDAMAELRLIASSVETFTFAQVAERFTARGYPVSTLTGVLSTCLCQ